MDIKGVVFMKASNSDKLIVKFIIKSVAVSALCLLILCFTASEILYRLDLSTDCKGIITVVICAVTSAVCAFFSASGFKNHGAVLGMISQLPLLLFSLFNVIFSSSPLTYFLIKLAVCLLSGAFFGALRVRKSSSFKV